MISLNSLKYWIFTSMEALFLLGCSFHKTETGTGDTNLDAEVREIEFHDKQLGLLATEIDSLQSNTARTSVQDQKLAKAKERQKWHESRREEAIQRANEKGQNWNTLYNGQVQSEDRRR